MEFQVFRINVVYLGQLSAIWFKVMHCTSKAQTFSILILSIGRIFLRYIQKMQKGNCVYKVHIFQKGHNNPAISFDVTDLKFLIKLEE